MGKIPESDAIISLKVILFCCGAFAVFADASIAARERSGREREEACVQHPPGLLLQIKH